MKVDFNMKEMQVSVVFSYNLKYTAKVASKISVLTEVHDLSPSQNLTIQSFL